MKYRPNLKILPSLLFSVALAGPALAQSAGQSVENAGHSAGNAASGAWHSTKTAVKDTDITAKVKMALHNDKLTTGRDIHVNTHEGVVTLTGHASEAAADHAVRLARNITGVVSVNNDVRSGLQASSH
jgi:osmotically-inducible protein OsmY